VNRVALRHLMAPVVVLVALLIVGTLGYRTVGGWDLLDALYMTVITITTVGFHEVQPLGPAGRLFTMGLALGGVFTAFYAAGAFIRAIVTGEIRTVFGRQRMEHQLAKLSNHLVVCGFGRMGGLVCEEFSEARIPFVVIDRDPEVLADFYMPHGIPLVGDATADEVLKQAGTERARGLVTTAASDADNLYIAMSAHFIKEDLFIVARAESEGAERKLLRAGANRVISPYSIGGHRVAQAVLRPNAMDFIELATRRAYLELQIEEIALAATSTLVGATLKDSTIKSALGIIIVAIKRDDGRMLFNPDPETELGIGDVLIALGHRQQLDELEKMSGVRS
jgi:voltage-gated potassium channel